VEATSDATPIAPTAELLEPEQRESGDNPGMKAVDGKLISTGTPNTTTLTTRVEDGFLIDYAGGETKITPTVGGASASTVISENVAAVAANIASDADSVVRPQYNGVQTFQAIRSVGGPTQFSWKVTLHGDQALRRLDASHAEVVYGNGVRAFLITAEEAHDATGAMVPTSLDVMEDVLTLTVNHVAASFVYPVVSGQGWEAPYEAPFVIDIPEDDTERKEREELERIIEEGKAPPVQSTGVPLSIARQILRPTGEGQTTVPAPAYPSSGGASTSALRIFELDLSRCGWPGCSSWEATLDRAIFERGWDWAGWDRNGTSVHCDIDIKGAYETLGVLHADIEDNSPGFAGPYRVWKGEGKHLTTYCRFELLILVPEQGYLNNHLSMLGWVWPNGYQESVMREYDPPINEL
ncbi:MAG TPA: hypothetical protein VGG03_22680, partial [Thermoanaerobaculia bacterium]